MMKHNLKALAVLICVGLIVVVVQLGASQQILPSWHELLTCPPSEWQTSDEPYVNDPPKPIAIAEPVLVRPAPEPGREPPMRVANDPVDESPREQPSEVTEASDPAEVAAPSAVVATAPPMTEDAASPTSVADVLRRGGDLVEKGVELPQLWAAWTPSLLIDLTQRGYGDIVAEYGGRRFRLALEGAATLSAATFVAMTTERQDRLSNRGFPLNRHRRAGRWVDTPLRPVFADQERLIRSLVDAEVGDDAPVFTFYATGAFDRYLARKQLGAVAEIREGRAEDGAEARAAATSGRIVLTPRRPFYLIETVVIEGEEIHWRDPEADQVRM